MIDNFMSRSMHHMKTAMHVLQNTCDCLSSTLYSRINSGSVNEEDMTNISLLQDSTDHINEVNRMIQDITDLERLDQGHEYPLICGKVNLKSFGLALIAKTPNVSENVEVALELLNGGPAIIESDLVVLTRILGRLMENAVQATQKGTITLRIGYNQGRCTFTVIDSGPGVNTEDNNKVTDGALPGIFQKYHQEIIPEEPMDVDQATDLRKRIEDGITSHKKNGLGIGLATSYHLVRALGSDLRYSSRPGETVFWFSLPLKESMKIITTPLESQRIVKDVRTVSKSPTLSSAVKILPKKADLNQATIPQNLKLERVPFNVLVVEDTKSAAKLICMMLKRLECSSTHVEHGKEAIDLLRNTAPDMYNLILMDLRMPVMDGFEATKIIKDELKLKIPVIALTAETSFEVKNICEAIGFDGFHSKPLKRIQLKELVEKHKSSQAYLKAGGGCLDRHTQICASTSIEKLHNEERKHDFVDLKTAPVSKKMIASNGLKAMDKSSVLVVEDADSAAKLIRMMLTKLHCSSNRAENGKQAIDILRNALPGMYDLILMDIRMPVMDGLEATRIIKEELKLNIPIVALTGDNGMDIKEQCEKMGFDDFFAKPIRIPQIKKIIEKHALTHALCH